MLEGVSAEGSTTISHITDLYNLFGKELIVELNENYKKGKY